MVAIVFIGPTISAQEVGEVLDAECWPPAAQGDIYRALQTNPRAIGLIDGYFDGVASVWHKEILFALQQGVAVFGASSMGALRAAELHDFGMTGLGRIFESYKSGETEDDDEVAVVHGPAELGYVPLSEPMVNVRATLARAVSSGALSTDDANALSERAKALDYRQRTWPQIVTGGESEALPDWVSEHRVDQKKEDALALLDAIKQELHHPSAPAPHTFTFENTLLWQQGTASWTNRQAAPERERRVLDELLFSEAHGSVRRHALARKLAVELAYERQIEVSAAERREITREFREQASLLSAADLRAWLASNELSEDEFKALLVEEVCFQDLANQDPDLNDAHALGVLKLEGGYEALARRAESKVDTLEGAGRAGASLDDAALSAEALEDWYFGNRPDFAGYGSLDAFLAAHGLQSIDEFHTILLMEYLYLEVIGPNR